MICMYVCISCLFDVTYALEWDTPLALLAGCSIYCKILGRTVRGLSQIDVWLKGIPIYIILSILCFSIEDFLRFVARVWYLEFVPVE